jgi:hypothetical protein
MQPLEPPSPPGPSLRPGSGSLKARLAGLASSRSTCWLRRVPTLGSLALLAYAAGLGFRCAYVLYFHHPRHWVRSDAARLMRVAERLLGPSDVQSIWDTVWPPGAPASFALLAQIDPTLQLAAWLQLVLSALVPLLIAHATLLAAGRRAAALSLIFSSLHFGFVHYGGFLLAEQLFQFAVALALWLTLIALLEAERLVSHARDRGESRKLLGYGAATGAAWALATSVRPNALPVALLAGGVLTLRWTSRRQSRYLPLLAGSSLALLLALAPLAERCARLSGKFCLVSNNGAMNMVLGQVGEVHAVYFQGRDDAAPSALWAPPALDAYETTRVVPFSMFETRAALAWLWDALRSEPGSFLLRAGGNALRLFGFEYWPARYGPLPAALVTATNRLFLVGVLLPGCLGGWFCLRRAGRSRSAVGSLLAALPLAVAGVAAFSLGEPRYRVPFDGAFILLAAAFYSGAVPGAERASKELRGGRLLASGGGVAALACLLIVLVSHPKSSFAARVLGGDRAPATGAAQHPRAVSEFGPAKQEGDPWQGAGSYVFHCTPACPELLVATGGTWRAAELELSLDARDVYQVTFYRQGQALAYQRVHSRGHGSGLSVQGIEVPARARAGFDAVGIWPLYGDGRYSIGHLRPGQP